MDKVIGLEKYFSEPTLPNGVILQVELVETVEGILMGMHI